MFFTSTLPVNYLEDLKNLFYFNENQYRIREDIVTVIEMFGTPSIVQKNGLLRVALDSHFEPQAVFVLENEKPNAQLIGVFVYVRDTPDNIALTYISVDMEYSSSGKYADKMLPVKMFGQMRRIASVIKGVETLTVFFNRKTHKLKVRNKGGDIFY
jgi:hypothetical protein